MPAGTPPVGPKVKAFLLAKVSAIGLIFGLMAIVIVGTTSAQTSFFDEFEIDLSQWVSQGPNGSHSSRSFQTP